MSAKQVKGLRVIEVPFLTNKKHIEVRSTMRRELDDFRLCGLYSKAGVPFEIVEASFPNDDYPKDGSRVFELSGKFGSSICKKTEEGVRNGKVVLLTGGDCKHPVGVLAGLQKAVEKDKKIGFIWLDSHGDFNTPETSPSGMLGGMPLAVCAGLCCDEWRLGAGLEIPLPTENIILCDGRNLDTLEEKAVKASKMLFIDTKTFNDRKVWKKAIDEFAAKMDLIYLHIDLDFLDAQYVTALGLPEPDGPDVETAMADIRAVMETGKVMAYSVVSIFHNTGKPGQDMTTLNGMRLIGAGLESWKNFPEIL
jgi:arginase